MKHKLLFFIFFSSLYSCADVEDNNYQPLPDLSERIMAGGETTIFSTSSIAFSSPAPNLSASELADHIFGDQSFETVFITAPSEINPGLGPIFNNSSCIACHPADGRAPFPSNLNSRSGFFLRTSIPGTDQNGGPVPVPGFGLQIQNQALFGYQPEAQFSVTYQPIVETFADGTKVTLQKPIYSLTDTYIPTPANMMLSPRIGSPVFGLGLLEMIPDEDILAAQDINDIDGDGISGKANMVYDEVSQSIKIGRFGWKANTATVLEQCAAAYVHDMGITNTLFPQETGFGQTNGSDNLNDDPELEENILNKVTFYCRTLAVPAPRNINDLGVRNGARIFEEIECAKCHTPKQKTGYSPINALAYQTFYPYTDMLLHDMGEHLADNRPDFLANGREWKTRPLWGIGLTYLVNGHTHFLHDGRAKNLTEAILWHGGEAEKSKNAFKNLSKKDRDDLIKFLNSL